MNKFTKRAVITALAAMTAAGMATCAFAAETESATKSPANKFGFNVAALQEEAEAADEMLDAGMELPGEPEDVFEDSQEEARLSRIVIFGADKEDESAVPKFVTVCIIDKDHQQVRTATIGNSMLQELFDAESEEDAAPEGEEVMEGEAVEAADAEGEEEADIDIRQRIINRIDDVLGLDLSSYLAIDVNQMSELIDKIGGIDMELSQAEAARMNTMYDTQFEEGVCSLSGEQAIALLSWMDNDEKAQDLLGAMFAKAVTLQSNDQLMFAFGLLSASKANITSDDVLTLATIPFGDYSVAEAAFPDFAFEGDYAEQEDGSYLMDLEAVNARLQEFVVQYQEAGDEVPADAEIPEEAVELDLEESDIQEEAADIQE